MAKAKIDKRDQAERLLRYLELLSRGGFFAVPQMAGMFGVRPEGVYRDIRRLIALGYPMETEKKSGLTVYRFPANWQRKVRKVEFSLHEIEVALLAVEHHCRQGPPPRKVQLAVGKLQALHAESGPPARVRAWNRIVREAGGVRTDSPVDSAVAQRCARLHVPDKRGERDALIAATALVHGMTLVTRNTADFKATGVNLLNPWEASP